MALAVGVQDRSRAAGAADLANGSLTDGHRAAVTANPIVGIAIHHITLNYAYALNYEVRAKALSD